MFDKLRKEDENKSPITYKPPAETKEPQPETKNTITLDTDLPMVLESLEVEEQALMEEKADLIVQEAKLTQQIKNEIKMREKQITQLKSQIEELKLRCETLANILAVKIE